MRQVILPRNPRLYAQVDSSADGLRLFTASGELSLEPTDDITASQLLDLLRRLDGNRTIQDLADEVGLDRRQIASVLQVALEWGLLGDESTPQAISGLAALSQIEHTLNYLLEKLVIAGPFWSAIVHEPERLHPHVYYGFGLENWFYLDSAQEFSAPVLAHVETRELRRLVGDFHHEEYLHSDIIVGAFEFLGITEKELGRSRPLPTTTALVKSLSWWARSDPLFCLVAIDVLEGRQPNKPVADPNATKVAYDSFLAACDKLGLRDDFVEPIRNHVRINALDEHTSVCREFFTAVPGVDRATLARWQAKAHLFMECYAAFFNGMLAYYGDGKNPLLRTVEV
jgi:hypothetical protein